MKYDTLLIVDDVRTNRALLRGMFCKEWRILEAEDGERAYELIKRNDSRLAIILLDIIMPRMDGFQLLQKMQETESFQKIPVILITGDTSVESERHGYELGVSDVIKKPFDPYVVKRRVSNTIELYLHQSKLEELVAEQTKELESQAEQLRDANRNLIETLSTVVEFRNMESGQHIRRIKGLTQVMMEHIADDYAEYHITDKEIKVITSASAMHDVGKIAISDAILLKPGRLTPEEFEIMKTHTIKGCEIIESIAQMQEQEYYRYSYDICRYHHERYDGNGYPDHLKGEEIPICAQAVAIADVYDALVSARCYKEPYAEARAYQMIMGGECGVFSPRLLHCFEESREEFGELLHSDKL